VRCGRQSRQPLRHDRDHVRPDQHEGHCEPAEHGHQDLPADAALVEHPVHRGGLTRREGGLGVRQPDEVGQAERASRHPRGDRVDTTLDNAGRIRNAYADIVA